MRTNTTAISLGWAGAVPSRWLGAVNPVPPDFPIGQTTVTFDGVPAGAEIRVTSGLTDLAGVESCVTNQSLVWDAYADGSPLNSVRVLIIRMDYRIRDFSYTARVGAQTVPVQLEKDKWAFNPD